MMMSCILRSEKLLFLCLVPLLLAGCQRDPATKPLVVYCGAGIRPPVEELARRFEQETGVRVECDFAGSEVLLSRLKLSQTGDLYLPGDSHYVELARELGLVSGRRDICYFVPVILVAKGNPKDIHGLRDLMRPGIRVGLGDPNTCAIGRIAEKIFAKNDITGAIENQVAFRSLTVNELGDKVKLGALDAVIVWDATAAYYTDTTETVRIPTPRNVISTVPVAMLTVSTQPEQARALMEYLASDQGKSLFQSHHYTVTKPQ